MPSNQCNDYGWNRAPKKKWRYPGVPIPMRLQHRYALAV